LGIGIVRKNDIHFIGLKILQLVKGLVYGCQHLCTGIMSNRVSKVRGRSKNGPRSNDCFAIPLEASRPAKFPYIPSIRSQ
jgi:hypothetical protein